MKTTALAMAIVLALATPALAASKKAKTAAKPANAPAAENTNEASWRLAKDSLPIWLPSWSLPIYQQLNKDQTKQAAARPKTAKAKNAKNAKK